MKKNEVVANCDHLNGHITVKNIFASKYKLYLPTEEDLKKELERERSLIEIVKK